MDIELSPRIRRMIEDEIRECHFPDAAAVIEAAIENFVAQRHAGESPEYSAALKAAVQVGLDQSDRGESAPWDVEEIRAEVRRLHRFITM